MDSTTTQLYIGILEKTNQQLSLWTNPYGILVGALSILFTILTIVAVFIILRQGTEYKKYYQKAVNEYKNVLTQEMKTISENAKKGNQLLIDNGNIEIERLRKIKEPTQLQIEKIKQLEGDIKRLESKKDYFVGQVGMQAGLKLSDTIDSIKLVTPNNIFGYKTDDSLLTIGGDYSSSNSKLYFKTCDCGNFITGSSNYCSSCGKKI